MRTITSVTQLKIQPAWTPPGLKHVTLSPMQDPTGPVDTQRWSFISSENATSWDWHHHTPPVTFFRYLSLHCPSAQRQCPHLWPNAFSDAASGAQVKPPLLPPHPEQQLSTLHIRWARADQTDPRGFKKWLSRVMVVMRRWRKRPRQTG